MYVGKGVGRRIHDHRTKSHNKKLRFLFENHPDTPIVKIREEMTEPDAFRLEAILIEVLGRQDLGKGSLFNLSDGYDGAAGAIRSPETREKMRQAKLGKPRSPESIAKTRAANLGKKRTQEWKDNHRAAMTGRKRTEEQKKKIGAAHKGIKMPESHREKLRNRVVSLETRNKLSAKLIGNTRNKGKKRTNPFQMDLFK